MASGHPLSQSATTWKPPTLRKADTTANLTKSSSAVAQTKAIAPPSVFRTQSENSLINAHRAQAEGFFLFLTTSFLLCACRLSKTRFKRHWQCSDMGKSYFRFFIRISSHTSLRKKNVKLKKKGEDNLWPLERKMQRY